jgi:uncharacterized protein
VSLWTIFATGLLAGGASCAAVQGGLLAGVIARRKGESYDERGQRKKPASAGAQRPAYSGIQDLVPVTGFLVAKLISHVILGALLGLLGNSVQVGFKAQAVMLVVAGIVMILMALDLLGVGSVRKLIPAAPSSWSALVRKRAKSSAAFAPAALGFMTVLIPCGVTLSMELLAIASGSPVTGALIMGFFVLGTSPLFAALGYGVRRAGAALGSSIGKAAAAVVLVVAVVTINSGLVLAGSPISLNGIASDKGVEATGQGGSAALPSGEVAGPAAPSSTDVAEIQTLAIDVENRGYSPNRIEAKAGIPTKLVLKTAGTSGCTRAFVIPHLNIQKVLPFSGVTEIQIGALRRGKLGFTCSMGMYRGEINAT